MLIKLDLLNKKLYEKNVYFGLRIDGPLLGEGGREVALTSGK